MNIVTQEHSEMLDMLLEGKTVASISRVLGKSRTTIYNWLRLDYIKVELENRKVELKREARDKITNNVLVYIENMRDLACNSTDPRVKLQANKYLLDQVIGTPGTVKEEVNIKDKHRDDSKDILQNDLDNIKRMK